MKLLRLACLSAAALTVFIANAQTIIPRTPAAAAAPTVVPTLVPYSGVAMDRYGKPLSGEMLFTLSLFKEEEGGEPLWSESQSVVIDSSGHYQLQLGASSENGLPVKTFASGEGRWLELQIDGQDPKPRVLLMSVPYAMKAADAATLGGLPASAFALAGQPTRTVVTPASSTASPLVTPAATTNVTTTGGTSGQVPVFNGTSSVVNSNIYTTSFGIGINHGPGSGIAFDVLGKMVVRGIFDLGRTSDATTSAGASSNPLQFHAQVYNSAKAAYLNPFFELRAEPVGNNSATTGAKFNLLYSNGTTSEAETGLAISGNGTLTFAPGQTFPGATGTPGPTGPAGPSGPAGTQFWTSTTLLQPFTDGTDQYGAVMGVSNAISGTDFYARLRSSLVFPVACTASNFTVSLGYESLSFPFDLTTTLNVNGLATPLTCDTGFANNIGFTCTSSATYAISTGAKVALDFSHTGTDPSFVYPSVTFTCK